MVPPQKNPADETSYQNKKKRSTFLTPLLTGLLLTNLSPELPATTPKDPLPIRGYAFVNEAPFVFVESPSNKETLMLSLTPDPQGNQILSFDPSHGGEAILENKTVALQGSPQPPPLSNPESQPEDHPQDCDCDYCHDPSEDPPLNPNFFKDLLSHRRQTFLERSEALKARQQTQYILVAIIPYSNPPQNTQPFLNEEHQRMWTIPSRIEILDQTTQEKITLEDNGHWTDILKKTPAPTHPKHLSVAYRLLMPNLEDNKILMKTPTETLIVEYPTSL